MRDRDVRFSFTESSLRDSVVELASTTAAAFRPLNRPSSSYPSNWKKYIKITRTILIIVLPFLVAQEYSFRHAMGDCNWLRNYTIKTRFDVVAPEELLLQRTTVECI